MFNANLVKYFAKAYNRRINFGYCTIGSLDTGRFVNLSLAFYDTLFLGVTYTSSLRSELRSGYSFIRFVITETSIHHACSVALSLLHSCRVSTAIPHANKREFFKFRFQGLPSTAQNLQCKID